ncbi:hypothetical protein [Chitinimonas taiwanensis]|uniref:hypothetical protein n=1 Tax=Chitinimonas taiwanensis TaxID=240412 RepID=UPI0035AE5CFD
MKKLFPKGSAQFYVAAIASIAVVFYSEWVTLVAQNGMVTSLVAVSTIALLLLAVIGYWVSKNTDRHGELTFFKPRREK